MTNKIVRILNENTLLDLQQKLFKRIANSLKKKYLKTNIPLIRIDRKRVKLNRDFEFYYSLKNRKKIERFYNENLELKYEVIDSAEKILKGIYNVFELEEYQVEGPKDWNSDLKSKFSWENDFYSNIQIIDFENNADVKIPWELSRFNFLFTLGKAYWITKDRKYYIGFKNIIIDWIESNPYCNSVNWTCTMEVAIRSINWIFSYFHFEEEINKDEIFKQTLLKELELNREYIMFNLENYSKLRNNHYISNLVGLLYIELFLENNNMVFSNKRILKFVINELEKEMATQVNEDGTSYETSTNYQSLVNELFLHAIMIADMNKLKFSIHFKERLLKAFYFQKNITKMNGFTPLVGDIDSGRLLIISDYFKWNRLYLNQNLGVAATYFNEHKLLTMASLTEEEIWLNYKNTAIEPRNKSNELLDSVSYSTGGYYILRNPSIYIFIRCGELSMRGQGGHSHNDQLSIEVNINGEDLFVDAGNYTYTGNVQLRNLYRSTEYHNTVRVNKKEQNDFNDDIFSLPEQTHSKVLKCKENQFIGQHYGYYKELNIIHKRNVILCEKSFKIIDSLISDQTKEMNVDAEQIFILASDVKILNSNNKVLFQTKNTSIISNIKYDEISTEKIKISIGYLKTIETNRLIINSKSLNELEFTIL